MENLNRDSHKVSDMKQRLGVATADFVASLEKKAGEVRRLLASVDADPGAQRLREGLRRRLHALASSARALHLSSMDSALAGTIRLLDEVPQTGSIERAALCRIGKTLDELPSLAKGDRRLDELPVLESIESAARSRIDRMVDEPSCEAQPESFSSWPAELTVEELVRLALVDDPAKSSTDESPRSAVSGRYSCVTPLERHETYRRERVRHEPQRMGYDQSPARAAS